MITQKQEDKAAGNVMETSRARAKNDLKSFMFCYFLHNTLPGRGARLRRRPRGSVEAEVSIQKLQSDHKPGSQIRRLSVSHKAWKKVVGLGVPDGVGCERLVTGQEPSGERPRPGL